MTSSPSCPPQSPPPQTLWKRGILVMPLVLILLFLKDTKGNLAVATALENHPPSLRIYRALLEITLLLFCTAFALRIWSTNRDIGKDLVGQLLFQAPSFLDHNDDDDDDRITTLRTTGPYEPVSAADDDDEEVTEDDNDLQDNHDEEKGNEEDSSKIKRDEIIDEDEFLDQDDAFVKNEQVGLSTTDGSPIPPPSSVVGAALDLLLTILISLFFFTISSSEGGRLREANAEIPLTFMEGIASVAAPIFPLVLFIAFAIATILPWGKRGTFWLIISLTVGAPFCEVTFRDGFVGDILTSSVRPMQDLAFTLFYITSGLQGWWSQSYDLDAAATPVEHSWLLHTGVLPACMVSPLWWRFLQNLRQAYEHKQRWPYLGNAFKYFVAAEIAMFGVFDPAKKQHIAWLTSFVLATLYQVWWDVFMDWDLFTIHPRRKKLMLRPTLYYPLWVYYVILVVNFCLRFCWTLSFLPVQYLHETGILKNNFEDGDWTAFIGPFLASAEIVRRTLWGLIRLEAEAIKVKQDTQQRSVASMSSDLASSEIEMKTMKVQVGNHETMMESSTTDSVALIPMKIRNDLSDSDELHILGELCLWATAFTSLGILAAAHRQTM